MNFSVHFDDETLERLNRAVEATGMTRNRLISIGVKDWLLRFEASDWPPALREHFRNPAPELAAGIADFQVWKPGEDR
ncbi:MAG: CopG family transcriptional regulator [Hydrocarboniphaga sp.]|uniref:CopG family transcriptional regulator n=1 Tax=Hydrocarboniphaga sp. TaxID=2033016 RepID=UPI002639499E|nr:CopG family transcriptional regulator [Hydrocarboniphaga sp.]MDB5968089.1 CopG family transcriptional regulator [Hydrocarboniphaga sp.]